MRSSVASVASRPRYGAAICASVASSSAALPRKATLRSVNVADVVDAEEADAAAETAGADCACATPQASAASAASDATTRVGLRFKGQPPVADQVEGRPEERMRE